MHGWFLCKLLNSDESVNFLGSVFLLPHRFHKFPNNFGTSENASEKGDLDPAPILPD